MIPEIGSKWKNLKTGNTYEILLLSTNSENPDEHLISYSQLGIFYAWTRPLDLFLEKFEEIK